MCVWSYYFFESSAVCLSDLGQTSRQACRNKQKHTQEELVQMFILPGKREEMEIKVVNGEIFVRNQSISTFHANK